MTLINLTERLGGDTSTENVMFTVNKVFQEMFNENISDAWVRPELFSKAIEKRAAKFRMTADKFLPLDTIAAKGRVNPKNNKVNTALFVY